MKSNKVPKADTVPKRREHLSAHPLSMAPERVKEIEKAFDVLRSRDGDKERELVGEQKKLGSLPKKFREQVHWLVDLEGKIQGILDLVCGLDVFNAIFNLFWLAQFRRVAGDKYTREKLGNIKNKLVEFRDTTVPGQAQCRARR